MRLQDSVNRGTAGSNQQDENAHDRGADRINARVHEVEGTKSHGTVNVWYSKKIHLYPSRLEVV